MNSKKVVEKNLSFEIKKKVVFLLNKYINVGLVNLFILILFIKIDLCFFLIFIFFIFNFIFIFVIYLNLFECFV